MLFLKLSIELLGHLLDVETELQATCYLDDLRIAFLEVGDLKQKWGDFAEEEVTGLTANILVRSGSIAAIAALHPIPFAASAVGVDEDQQILVVEFGNLAMDYLLRVRIGNPTVGCVNLHHCYAAELRDHRSAIHGAI